MLYYLVFMFHLRSIYIPSAFVKFEFRLRSMDVPSGPNTQRPSPIKGAAFGQLHKGGRPRSAAPFVGSPYWACSLCVWAAWNIHGTHMERKFDKWNADGT